MLPTKMEVEPAIHNERLTKKLQSFYENGTMCNVTLRSEDFSIKAHRLVLASCSEYFLAMFSGNWAESNEGEVPLKGLTAVGLQAVVEFAYYGKFSPNSLNISEIISALHQCMVIDGLELCENYMIDNLDESNFAQFFELSETFQFNRVMSRIVCFILDLMPTMVSSENSDINPCIFQVERNLLNLVLAKWDYSAAGFGQFAAMMLVLQWARSDLNDRKQYITGLMTSLLKREITTSAAGELLAYVEEGSAEQETCLLVTGSSDSLLAYNSELKKWYELPTIDIARDFRGTAVVDNCLYICGGFDGTVCAECYKYVPHIDRWFLIKSMQRKRGFFPLVGFSGKLYAIGGMPSESDDYHKSVEFYDPAANLWCEGVPLPKSLAAHAAAPHGGNIYVSGGFSEVEDVGSDELLCYSCVEGAWSYKKSMLEGRLSHAMVAHKDCLFVCGGEDDSDQLHSSTVNDPLIEVYDISTDNWTRMNIFERPDFTSVHGFCSFGDLLYFMFENCLLEDVGPPCPNKSKDWKLLVATYQPSAGSMISLCEGDSIVWMASNSSGLGRWSAPAWVVKIPSLVMQYMSLYG
ncbi:kelch-like protein 32 [Lineus longissimus]|uniref:kelch-like protein 32 n=1 Tax=Lineus longissimus TaxID=88925 RepID=UPI002B4E47B2